LRIARMNIAGDFLDLQAAGLVDPETDPMEAGQRLCESYSALWTELTRVEEFSVNERWRIDERIRRLNDLGFDLGELTVTTDLDGISLLVEPKVVEPNHHSRRLLRLTGIGANENQARAMLNDLDSFRSDPALTDVDDLDESRPPAGGSRKSTNRSSRRFRRTSRANSSPGRSSTSSPSIGAPWPGPDSVTSRSWRPSPTSSSTTWRTCPTRSAMSTANSSETSPRLPRPAPTPTEGSR